MKTLGTIFIWLTVCSGLLSQNYRSQIDEEAYALLDSVGEICFSFTIDNSSDIAYLTSIISIDNVRDNKIIAYANKKEFETFLRLGIPYEIIDVWKERSGIVMGCKLKGIWDWDTYPTYPEYDSMMNQFASDYSSLCKIYSIGTTVDGREILFARLSGNIDSVGNKPQFMYSSSMHGDEITGYVLMLRLIHYLLSNYGMDSRITSLLDSLDIWINPLANPDGTYAGGDNSVAGATRSNANYVDINRNFPDPDDGQHPDENAWQPEVVAMMNFTDTMNFILAANFHGGSEVVNYPWDTWARLHADDSWFQHISHRYADSAQANSIAGYMDFKNDGITNGYAWYTITGGRQDFMNYFRRCREVTIEISDIKIVTASSLPDYWDYNKESLLGYMENALRGIYGWILDENGNPVNAEIEVLTIDNNIDNSKVFSGSSSERFYRMLLPGTYDIVVTADGFSPRTIEDVVVVDSIRTWLDITLYETRDYIFTGVVRDEQNGFAIPRAKVHLTSIETEPVFTDNFGRFEIPGVQPALYTVKVSKPEFINKILPVTISETDTIEDFTISRTHAVSFEYGNIDTIFDNSAKHPWIIDSLIYQEGYFSISSGLISDDESSVISLSMEVSQADSISFYLQVQSELLLDFFNFYMDSVLIDQWSGHIDWQRVAFPVSEGNHTFTWEYTKDPLSAYGLDRAWLDFIELPEGVEEKADVEGYVYDLHTSAPLSGINVRFYSDSVYETTTDVTGFYSLSQIPQDLYYCQVYRDGYDSLTSMVNVDTSNVTRSFYLSRQINFKGQVYNIVDETPVEGATAKISGPCQATILSDSAGVFRLNNISQGSYTFEFTKTGYQNLRLSTDLGLYDTLLRFDMVPISIIDFETVLPAYYFRTEGDAEWYRDSQEFYEGGYSLRSGLIDHGSSTTFILGPLNILSDGIFKYYVKTSSENDWDRMELYINDTLKDIESGEMDWTKREYTVLKGENEFKWVYSKNDLLTIGSDAVWIDYIVMPQFKVNGSNMDDSLPDKGFRVIVYPNPAMDDTWISIQLSAPSYFIIKLYNLQGSELWGYSSDESDRGIFDIPLPVSHLKQGIYICKIKTRFGVKTRKIIKIE